MNKPQEDRNSPQAPNKIPLFLHDNNDGYQSWPDEARQRQNCSANDDELWMDNIFELDAFPSNDPLEEDTTMQDGQQRWPLDQRIIIADDELWMNHSLDERVTDRKVGGTHDHFANTKQSLDDNKHCDKDYYSASLEPPQQKSRHKALHKTIDDITINGDGVPPGPLSYGELVHNRHDLQLQTKYVTAMYSAYSIQGWGDSTSLSSPCFPCHHIHLLKEPVLLTLTSYPFRIVYANNALLQRLRTNNIVGSALFDVFYSNDLATKPCLPTSDIILRSVLNENGMDCCTMPIGDADPIPCLIKAHPVVSMQKEETGKTILLALRIQELYRDMVAPPHYSSCVGRTDVS